MQPTLDLEFELAPVTGAAEAAARVVQFPVAAPPVAALPSCDVLGEVVGRDVARALLARFGGVAAVLAGDQAELTRIAGRGPARTLAALHELTVRAARDECSKRCVISSWSSLLAYVRAAMAHESREQFRVMFLDKKNQLITDEVMNKGTVDHAPVYPREVVRRALEVDASAIIVVHNHPSGDPTPSSADIDMTRQIIDACRVLRIALHDHLVVGRDGVASFKALGLI